MSNNVALDSWHLDSPLSNLSTPSQADESATTASDRIFFGPLQSPEKKYAAPSGGARFRTPIRRSTRLSTAMVPLPLFPETVAEGVSTREGTPEEDSLPDEPSIILASRVLSACSNPSPPPSPPPTLPQPLREFDDIQLVDVTDPDDEEDTNVSTPKGPLIALDGLSEPIVSSSPFIPPPPVTAPEHPDDQTDVSQPDLITFDSFSEADPGPNHVASIPSSVAASTPSRLVPKSIDDLLSMSPNPISTSSAQAERAVMQEIVMANDATVTPDEEMEVVHSLVHGGGPRAPSPPLIEMTAPEEETVSDAPAPMNELAVTSEEDSPPLRRSTRPRRSRSSLPQTVTTPSPKVISPDKRVDVEAANDSDTTPQSQQRKRKAKPSPAREDKGDEAAAEVLATPKSLPQLARSHRELGSLSPLSAAVLTQLLPPGGDSVSGPSTPLPPPPEGGSPATETLHAPAPKTPPHQTTSFVFPRVGSSDTLGDARRPKSPLRPFSPYRFAEGSRTPARRVPITQAIAEGTYSSQKLLGSFATTHPPQAPGSPVFKKPDLDNPGRSPARRVPMSEALPVPPPSPVRVDKGKGKAVFRTQSPVRVPSAPPRERNASAEPPLAFGRKARGTSVEPSIRPPALGRRPLFQKPASSDGTSSSVLKPRTVLPFPITGQQRLPPAIPEAEEPSSSVARPRVIAATASPVKHGSSLRQPSAGAGSKIPRIGVKPYARPRAGAADAPPSKLPTPAKARIVTKAKPLRIINVGSSSGGSSSDEGPAASTAVKRAAVHVPDSRRALMTQSSTTPSDSDGAHGLKRKREPETAGLKTSTPGAQPVIVMRKVVPGMFNKGKETSSGSTPRALPSAGGRTALTSPQKPSGPIKARSALDWKKPQPEGQPPPAAPAPLKAEKGASVTQHSPESVSLPVVVDAQAVPTKDTREPSPPPRVDVPDPAPAPPPAAAPPPAPTSVLTEESPDVANEAVHSEPAPPPAAEETTTSQRQRRSTRSKRGSAPSTDVFGSVVSTTSTRPSQSRRRGPLPSETAGPFAGMSALALKTLTSANTVRNQQQVVIIQTEVIRKEGPRPDSPTTRVRSALEKQKEELALQRKERAERRARRSTGSDLDDPPAGSTTGDETAMDGAPDGGDASFMSVDRDGDSEAVPIRHRRGPGDEEDYETPPRPERPAKRGRFEGGDDEGAKERDPPQRRVKWDKGLHTTVFLNDTPPKPKWNTKAVPSHKSCLTPAAKALRLDTLGNVLNAEAPLGGLVKENITVKKFVFEDDAVPEPETPAPPPDPPVKSTRSKSKKTKS
ncbi:hypothetical protein OH76DRAFT_1551234 [Lentinus brumalis]|uniref:Uncharacterized protein n=1 Tax=Lentinus brumalis TaxID=2498619 RepID=A0A371DWB3_9APHY|nr:hypothetical protein OH76DRAFT_1551234 [Polyporus brumalis]